MRERNKEETALFYIGWSLTGIVFFLYLTCRIFSFSPFKTNAPCLMHALLGLYCPGCGGTRAISMLFHGQLWDSFLCHPLVPYTALVGGWFLISQTIERVSRHRIKIGLHYRDIYLWIALGIVVVNFILKNLLLVIWNIDILANYKI